ncbi:cation:proton antiporter domain-containing protein [Microbaculum sp. FT89]|uniref:cation:proton antiporter domain-containing protein n=1 Tax=Microbaculum sp. FT89 TaxID=3447298 RepID=UPI003F52A628
MEDQAWLSDALVFLIVAGVVVPVFHRFRLGTVLGFIVAGVVVGPFGLGRFQFDFPLIGFIVLEDPHRVEPFAELGVVFLLFVLGLEMSFARLWEMKRYVLGVGTVQVVATTVLIGAIVALLGQPGPVALAVGLALALSSTAIVMQLLVEERRLATTTGRVSLSVLLMQDMMVVPALIIVSLLAASGPGGSGVASWSEIGVAMIEAFLVVAAIVLFGRYVLRPLLRQAALTGIRELIMAMVLFTVVAAAIGTEAAGLSPALGAFLAGLLLAESEYRHQIEVDIEPFKGLLLGLFFITVGMSIDLAVVAKFIVWLIPAVIGLIALKAAVTFLTARVFGVSLHSAAETAIMLAQAGEFGFVVFALARSSGILSVETTQFLIVVIGLSMAVTPFLSRISVAVSRRVEEIEQKGAASPGKEIEGLEGHVVIGGFGRVGRTIARVLESENVPYVAIDQNARLVGRERQSGRHIFFGDAGREEILDRAGADRARAFIVTVDSPRNAEHMVQAACRRRPNAPVYARARDTDHARALAKLGAEVVVPEAVEGSLRLAGRILSGLGWPDEAVSRRIDQERERELVQLESGKE